MSKSPDAIYASGRRQLDRGTFSVRPAHSPDWDALQRVRSQSRSTGIGFMSAFAFAHDLPPRRQLWMAGQRSRTLWGHCKIGSVMRHPLAAQRLFDAAMACADHVGGDSADESIECLGPDCVDHALADDLGVEAGCRKAFGQHRLVGRANL